MKYKAVIEVPNNASWQTIEDAKIKAVWKLVEPKEERMARTNLNNKCGSCKKFCPFDCSSYGTCERTHCLFRVSRTRKACKDYERDDKKWRTE